RLHADEAANPRISTLQFLRHEAVFHVTHACATVSLQRSSEKAHFRHGLNEFPGKPSCAIALFDDRNQIVFNELASAVANQSFFVGEQGIKLDEVDTT